MQRELREGAYEFSGYITFKVYEPKEREINAPHYRDKVVQLAINNILKEIYQPSFIYDSYACIDNKGTHACVAKIYKNMRKARWEYGESATIIKIDFKKYFYSIDRQILKKLYTKKIKDKKALNLIYKIIDSADVIDKLGLPLGNTNSQISSNMYLNEIDQYAKRSLRVKYYVRYMDDITIIAENKEKAKKIQELLKAYAKEKLNIEVNENKTKIFPVSQGVNTIGFKIYPTHMLLRNDSKKRIKRKLKKFKNMLIEGRITIEKVEQILNSWYGHAQQANSFNFIQSLLRKFDYIELVKKKSKGKIKETFKIKKGVIENARKPYFGA